jgi:hypothetical protein
MERLLGSEAPSSSDTGSAQPPLQPPTYGLVPHSEPRCRVFVDKEQQDSSVYLSFKVPRR